MVGGAKESCQPAGLVSTINKHVMMMAVFMQSRGRGKNKASQKCRFHEIVLAHTCHGHLMCESQFLSSSSTPDIPDSNGCAHPAASTSRNSCRPPDARGADTPGGDRGWSVGRKKAANPPGWSATLTTMFIIAKFIQSKGRGKNKVSQKCRFHEIVLAHTCLGI